MSPSLLSRRRPRRRAVPVVLVLGLAGVAQADARTAGEAPLCSGAGVSVRADFERAAAAACRIDADEAITIEVRPETIPVNVSPWYAFVLESGASGVRELVLSYPYGRHRYVPWTSLDGQTWQRLAPGAVRTEADGALARMSLSVPAGRLWVAAQPPQTIAEALAPWRARVAKGLAQELPSGTSVEGRPVPVFRTRPLRPRGTLVLLARQHPPEEPGAWAHDAFAARLFEADPLAVRFREAVAVLALPVMNPDGLVQGHWRANAAGLDLNRDWGPFTQPETRAARDAIAAMAEEAPVVALFDFHATRRDVIYAHLDAPGNDPHGLFGGWAARWTAALGNDAPRIDRRLDADQANSKNWGLSAHGVSAVTYEVGDNTPPDVARARARLAAEALMIEALARLPER